MADQATSSCHELGLRLKMDYNDDPARSTIRAFAKICCPTKVRNRSRLRTKPAQATTDKHKFAQIEINSQSVFIRVHLWFKLSFSKCRERLQ